MLLLADPRVDSSNLGRVNQINCVSKFSSLHEHDAGLVSHQAVAIHMLSMDRVNMVKSPILS